MRLGSTAQTIALAAISSSLLAGCRLNTAVLQRGADPSAGVLFNYSCGAHPCDPIDPSKPTIVFTHGWNPLPRRIRCTFGPSSAAALKRRCGDSYNILSWDWNAVRVSPFNDEPVRIGREQGRLLAHALRCRGVNPGRTQLVAHSLGSVAVAVTARCMADRGRFCQVTLLDPPTSFHEEIFEVQRLTRHARCVENYWSDRISGFGGPVDSRGVRNYLVADAPHPILGIVDLSRSNHVHVMEWYYNTIRCPGMPCGFQNSVMRRCCGHGGQYADAKGGGATPGEDFPGAEVELHNPDDQPLDNVDATNPMEPVDHVATRSAGSLNR